jgi:hypothetical protein
MQRRMGGLSTNNNLKRRKRQNLVHTTLVSLRSGKRQSFGGRGGGLLGHTKYDGMVMLLNALQP